MNRVLRAFSACAAAAPALLALWFWRRFSVCVPSWDEWDYLPLLRASYEHHLSFRSLFEQHNEHRILVPRLVMLAADHLTHYDNRVEMLGTWLCLCGIALVFFLEIRRLDRAGRVGALLLFVPVAIVVFTLRQWENLLWGLQIAIGLCALFAVLSLWLLTRDGKAAQAAAVGCGVAASFCFFNGLLIWPAGVAQLVSGRRLRLLPAWCIAGAATVAAYLHGYTKPAYHPSLTFFVQKPWTAFSYFLAAAGNAFSEVPRSAFAYGAVLAVLALAVLWTTLRKGEGRGISCGTVTFALGTWGALMIGRAGFGVEQALASRYVTFSVLGICGIYLCAVASGWSLVAAGTTAVMVAGTVASDAVALDHAPAIRGARLQASGLLLGFDSASDQDLRVLFPYPQAVRDRAAFLRQHRLGPFRHWQPPPAYHLDQIADAVLPQPVRLGGNAATVLVRGWAVTDGDSRQLLDGVEVEIDAKTAIPARYGVDRPDVGRALHDQRLSESGFEAQVPAAVLTPGTHVVQLRMRKRDGQTYSEPPQSIVVQAR